MADYPIPPARMRMEPLTPEERLLLLDVIDVAKRTETTRTAPLIESVEGKLKRCRSIRRIPVHIPSKDCYNILSGQAWSDGELARLREAIQKGLADAGLPVVAP